MSFSRTKFITLSGESRRISATGLAQRATFLLQLEIKRAQQALKEKPQQSRKSKKITEKSFRLEIGELVKSFCFNGRWMSSRNNFFY